MSIRKISVEDLGRVSSLCLDAFMETVAPTLQDEGVKTFRSIASIEGIRSRMDEDNEMLVFENNDDVVGFIELKEGHHISMLFVSPRFQKMGIGKSLVSAIGQYSTSDVITVSASLTSVSAYLKYGFECAGEASESAGLKFQPMELKLHK